MCRLVQFANVLACAFAVIHFFVRWEKNKKQDVGLRVEVRKIAVVFAFHFLKWFTFLFNCRLMCLFAVCCPPIGYNVRQLGDVAAI